MYDEYEDIFHISEEQYLIALKNGISRSNLYNRVNALGWGIEQAITTPIKQKNKYGNLRHVAKENGIPDRLFYDRINTMGWSPEKAATQPIEPREESVKRAIAKRREKSKVSPAILKLATENGICEGTLRARVYAYGYEPHIAATKPLKHVQIKKMG